MKLCIQAQSGGKTHKLWYMFSVISHAKVTHGSAVLIAVLPTQSAKKKELQMPSVQPIYNMSVKRIVLDMPLPYRRWH